MFTFTNVTLRTCALCILFCISQLAHADFTQPEMRDIAVDFVNAVKTNDPKTLSEFVKYPLARQNPIPPINNEQEFIQRFDELFDPALLERIKTSDIDKDWSDVGWRGVMLGSGALWLGYDGKVIAINHQTDKEKTLYKQLVAQQKQTLHASLSEFAEPVWAWQNTNYLIRIDEMPDGSYRYASWKAGASQSSKPDLVITGGKVEWYGTANNSEWIFQNGAYRYVFAHNNIHSGDWYETVLQVYKKDKPILQQTDFKQVY